MRFLKKKKPKAIQTRPKFCPVCASDDIMIEDSFVNHTEDAHKFICLNCSEEIYVTIKRRVYG